MSTITIDLPETIRQQLEETEELPRFTLEAVAVMGYRRAALSGSQVGAMLGLDYWDTVAFLSKHNVYPQYDVEDFQRDLETLDRLRRKQT